MTELERSMARAACRKEHYRGQHEKDIQREGSLRKVAIQRGHKKES
jgi:hypothetical protein